MDTEWRQVVRDLRRRAVPGDPAARAAAWIEQNQQDVSAAIDAGVAVPPAVQQTSAGLTHINASSADAQQYVQRNPPVLSREDHATRDMLTKETLAVLRQERDHALSASELQHDHDYISYIGSVFGGRYKHVSTLVALTARFAGEVPHDLIDTRAFKVCQERLSQGNYASYHIRVRELEDAITRVFPQHSWETFVDAGLVGNTQIACHELATMLPGLHGLNMSHVIEFITRDETHGNIFLDFFCSVTASVWRLNSVMAAQPYKTKYEHEAVLRSLQFSCRRFADFVLVDNHIQHRPRPVPTSLQQLRGFGAGAFLS